MKLLRVTPQTSMDLLADNLWDGKSPQLKSKMVVCIRQGLISKVIPQSDYVPSGAQQFHLPHLTLLPALIDAHVHLALDGEDFKTALNRWQDPLAMEELIKQELETTLEHGIAVIRDGSDRAGWNLRAKNWIKEGYCSGPRIVATGQGIHKKGYYGSFLGPPIATPVNWSEIVDRLWAAGSDQIKVIVSGLVTFRKWGEVGPLQFTLEELQELVNQAHRRGLKVMAHVNSEAGVRLAVEAGVDTLEHGYFLSEETLKRMADKGIFWSPTVAAVANRLFTSKREEYSPEEQDLIRRTYERQLEQIARAHELGVRLIVGTDAGAPGVYHGRSYMDELTYFLKAGLPARAILEAATATGAAALGLESELGSIEAGKKPYFIAVGGDPLQDIHVLSQLEMVIYV
ncbi:MAG: amidohydrolase family protein [Moorellaceae bacterium]